MQSNILLKWLLSIIILGIITFLIFIFFLNLPNKNSYIKPTSPDSNQTLQINPEFPVRLKIPIINVDAAIEHVGLTSEGAVDVPKNPINAAWFDVGPRPGENGSAVITGHYGRWKNGETSVFDNLYKLKKEDKLYVEDNKGIIITFVVREIRSYEPDAYASEVFISSDGKSHLNLITCEGVWDNNFKSYSKRLVVFTDKE